MSTAKKAISKGSSKSVPGMGELCTKQLWHQSIAAGKAEELVDMLMECEEGKAALKNAIPPPVECIIINRVNSDGGFCAYLRRNDFTEFLFMLLEVEEHTNMEHTKHPLGGFDITWETDDEMNDWVNDNVENMALCDQCRFFKMTVDVNIPGEDGDGEVIEDAKEYMDNEGDEWFGTVCDELRDILVGKDYKNGNGESLVYSSAEVKNFQNNGVVMRHIAVFTLHEENW